MPEFVLPTVAVQASFLRAMEEFRAEGVSDSQTAAWIDAFGGDWSSEAGFARFVAALREDELEETPRAANRVPCTTLWWVDGAEYLGRLAIRHRLNDQLLELGGHIGYDVRPSRRCEGHATAMLRESLPHARSLGVDPALLTCDHDNVASIRVIESAGGVFEDRRADKLRYWVPTGPGRSQAPVVR
ncbi:MAG: GNAT family N-acetyltransferase [Nocardioides sp.]|nr:GNAT family N-acetyltransferase [Nocardioides sp.]